MTLAIFLFSARAGAEIAPMTESLRPWTLTLEGLYGAMSFANDQNSATVELRRTDEKRRAVWARAQRARKFDQNADAFGMGGALPIPVPRSAVSFEAMGAPNQDILPEATLDSSFIHDPAGWIETIVRYRFAHYAVSNVHLMSPAAIWMPSNKLQASFAYYFTRTSFLGGGATVPDHSFSTRLLVRPVPQFHPWVAYTRSEESFEAGAGRTGSFSANHYLVGFQMPLWAGLELRGSVEYEGRSNSQILRTGAFSTVLAW